MLAKSGPATKRNARRPASGSSSTLVPVMSEGIRSGVNWIRLKPTSRIRAIELTISVLARPGHADQQDVAAGEDRRQDQLDHLALPDDDLVQLGDHDVARVSEFVEELRDPVAGRGHAMCRPLCRGSLSLFLALEGTNEGHHKSAQGIALGRGRFRLPLFLEDRRPIIKR